MNGSAFWNLVRKCASPIGARGRIIAVSGRREPLRRESGMAIARGVAITWFEIQKKQMDRKRKRGGLLRAADTCPISVVPAASVSAQLARRACGQQQQQHHQSLHCCAREIKSEKSTVRLMRGAVLDTFLPWTMAALFGAALLLGMSTAGSLTPLSPYRPEEWATVGRWASTRAGLVTVNHQLYLNGRRARAGQAAASLPGSSPREWYDVE